MHNIGVTSEIWLRGYLQEHKLLKDSHITKAHPHMSDRQLAKAGKS